MSEPRAVVVAPDGGEPLNVLGDLVVLRATGADTGGSAVVCEVTVWPGPGAPPHRHPPMETMQVLEGTVCIDLVGSNGSETVAASAGSVVVIPPNAVHRYFNDGEAPARFVSVLSPAGMESFFRELGEPTAAGERPPVPDGPPDVGRVMGIAERHGLSFPGPAGS